MGESGSVALVGWMGLGAQANMGRKGSGVTRDIVAALCTEAGREGMGVAGDCFLVSNLHTVAGSRGKAFWNVVVLYLFSLAVRKLWPLQELRHVKNKIINNYRNLKFH